MNHRKIVIGDVHAGLRGLKQLMEMIEPKAEDQLIFLGDYVDGWSEAVETVEYLMKLRQSHSCILLKGNHDDLCLKWLQSGIHNPMWLENGGKSTIDSYDLAGEEVKYRHLTFFKSLKNYHLDEENRLYVHAGFTNLGGVKHEYFEEMFYWDRTLWELALVMQFADEKVLINSLYEPKRLLNYHEIYIGHTPVSRVGSDVPLRAANIWNVDTGSAFKGCLSAIEVHTKQIWQSEPVYTLYPGERGRN